MAVQAGPAVPALEQTAPVSLPARSAMRGPGVEHPQL